MPPKNRQTYESRKNAKNEGIQAEQRVPIVPEPDALVDEHAAKDDENQRLAHIADHLDDVVDGDLRFGRQIVHCVVNLDEAARNYAAKFTFKYILN